MMLTFCGAAGIVTGSCYLLEIGNRQYLVDCGMFQGTKEITRKNYDTFPFKAAKIAAVFLTHAHIDHSGLLPKLRKEGFHGPIYATPATIDLCKIMLEDSAHVQSRETENENKRRQREGLAPRDPLYTIPEAKACYSLFRKIDYDRQFCIGNLIISYRDAGHILGSAIIEVVADDERTEKKIVFSGDLGQINVPIVKDPTRIPEADYVLVESTYGDREHEDTELREDMLLRVAKETYKRGGKLLIPSFAVERTQELLYAIRKLILQKRFPPMKVFLDSPLAVKATNVFMKHEECYDERMNLNHPFTFKSLIITPEVTDSMRLNSYTKPCVIIAGSGMANAGRIRHHLKHGLWDPKNTVLFVGFQAEGTLGRIILDGATTVRMMGMDIAVKARIEKINGFSAHADQDDLLWWMEGFMKKPKRTFIVHGEPRAELVFKEKLEEKGFPCFIPSMGEQVLL